MEQNEVDQNLPNSESIANIELPSDSFLQSSYAQNNMGSESFIPDIREKVFYIWYNNNRPGFLKTKQLIKEHLPNIELPQDWSLKDWIADFNARAFDLDQRIHEQIEAIVISEKVEMMKRHATTALTMQDMALEYLTSHKNDIAPTSAIRLLVEGIRIERESRGIPEALEKMSKLTDEEILSEIKQLMTSTSVKLEEVNADS